MYIRKEKIDFRIIIMKQITIRIPDNQLSFMMELLQKLNFVKADISKTEDNQIFMLNEDQLTMIETERQKAKDTPDYLLNWDDVKDTL